MPSQVSRFGLSMEALALRYERLQPTTLSRPLPIWTLPSPFCTWWAHQDTDSDVGLIRKTRVLSCAAAALRGKKSKLEEVFCGASMLYFLGAHLDALCNQATNAEALRNARSKGGFLHERTHHYHRPAIQSKRRCHAMGGDLPRTGNGRAVLDLDRAGRRSPSCDAVRSRVARRGSLLYRYRHRTENGQPAWKPARHSGDPDRRTQRGG